MSNFISSTGTNIYLKTISRCDWYNYFNICIVYQKEGLFSQNKGCEADLIRLTWLTLSWKMAIRISSILSWNSIFTCYIIIFTLNIIETNSVILKLMKYYIFLSVKNWNNVHLLRTHWKCLY